MKEGETASMEASATAIDKAPSRRRGNASITRLGTYSIARPTMRADVKKYRFVSCS